MPKSISTKRNSSDSIFLQLFKLSLFVLFSLIGTINTNAQNPQEGWSFEYPKDNFGKDALLDLRFLNEDEAGESGFVGLSDDKESFVDGAGNPIRFWSVNGGTLARNFSEKELAEYARFLAKMGVNMIRFHGSINPAGKGTLINEVDTAEVDAIWRMVAAMKKEGIYSTISPFWAHNGHMGNWLPKEWGIEGYSGKDNLWGVMYFNDTLKQAYKTWVKYLYTETNPYTGISLKDDSSVALIQIKNEDGVFWWTISAVKPEIEKIMMQKFFNWSVDKYDSIQKAYSTWNSAANPKDNFEENLVGLYHMYETTQPQTGGKAIRLSDQIEFMANTQFDFYKEIHDYYRELGCKQLINANNWKTTNANLLFDAERLSNTSCEVLAVNRYVDPGHIGEFSGWRIDPGHHYIGKSVLFDPHKLPVNIKQASGYPMLVTESGWNLPNKYQAEGPFLTAAYMSLTGVDSYYWFCPSASTFDANPYHHWTHLEGGQHPLHRWTLSTPGQLAMFPANALLFRKGYIKPGETTVHEERSEASIYGLEMPLISEENSFDPNRDSYDRINPNQETKVSPLAHLTGKIEVKYGGKSENSTVADNLNELIDYKNKTIKSSNEQLHWDYKNGVCLMDAPAAQGVCGFIGNSGQIKLSDVSIQSENEYAVINVVSMDDKSIAESEKILIQVGTVYRPKNWKDSPAKFERNKQQVSGLRIDNTGEMPWKCANTKVSIIIENKVISKATLLNQAGYKSSNISLVKGISGIELELPENAMYVILEKTNN